MPASRQKSDRRRRVSDRGLSRLVLRPFRRRSRWECAGLSAGQRGCAPLHRLLLEAGFARAEVDPRLPPMPPAAYARDAGTALQLLAGTILGQGWADAAELDAIAAALAAWGQRPDAQVLFVIHRAIGWVDA